jgi:ribosomal protein L21
MQAHIKATLKCKNNEKISFDSILLLEANNLVYIKQQIIKAANVDSNCDILDLEVQYLLSIGSSY